MESEARPFGDHGEAAADDPGPVVGVAGSDRSAFHRVSRTFRFQEEGFLEGFARLVSRSSTDPIAPDPRAEICAARSVRRARRRDFQHSSRAGLSRPTGESANRERPRGESFPRAFVPRGVIRTGKQSGTRAETRPTRPPNRASPRGGFSCHPRRFFAPRGRFLRASACGGPRAGGRSIPAAPRSCPTHEPPRAAERMEEDAKRRGGDEPMNSGGSGSGGEGGGSGGDKEVRLPTIFSVGSPARAPRPLPSPLSRSRARRASGPRPRLTLPSMRPAAPPPTPRAFADVRRERVRRKPRPGARQLRDAIQRLAAKRPRRAHEVRARTRLPRRARPRAPDRDRQDPRHAPVDPRPAAPAPARPFPTRPAPATHPRAPRRASAPSPPASA